MREDAVGQRRSTERRPSRETMSARPTPPASSGLTILDEVSALTAEVREQVARLRPLVDGRAIDPASELTGLLGTLTGVATRLEARPEALRGGEPALPPPAQVQPMTPARARDP